MNENSVVLKVKKAMLCMTRQCWEQGITAQALLETGDYERLSLLVRDMVLRQSEDGRLCNVENTPAVTDSTFCVLPVLEIGSREQQSKYIEAVEKNMDYLLHHAPRTPDGVICHMLGTQEIWADSAAFTPAALARTGHYREAFAQMKGYLKKLYDSEKKLYYHVWCEDTGEYRRKVLWGIGNGWILTGLYRLYLELPDSCREEKRDTYINFKELLDEMLLWENENHLFHDILDRPDSFEETEVSEMVAYIIYRAVREENLPVKYLDRADQIRQAVLDKVSDQGLLMDCASSPDFLYPGTSVEGQAHFLMMEQARSQILEQTHILLPEKICQS
ncbi:glycoside hydrolase family 88 protein [Diplocloster modestus]|uniref:Glycoside hydrolase family 88 protein n=1 Tax=Diplocloster modestus TaxID=2850322 RepID=A0ABS6K4E4_9FIRM|nr:glycoside hydrolase family 88 protein [Diplocloster modestus]MBU9725336.1 glycoside hydrolase family 88 protein [Diplocloster modestus]